MNQNSIRDRLTVFFSIGVGAALVTTVAGTNLFVLLLILTAPWAWWHFKLGELQGQKIRQFFLLVLSICLWDLFGNLNAGHNIAEAIMALLHDMRTFGFILVLWPVFATGVVSRAALWALMVSFVVLATANWR